MAFVTATDATFTLVVGRMALSSVVRFVEVVFTAGRLPAIDIRRETLTGRPCGAVRVFATSFPVLAAAIDSTRRGEVGAVGSWKTNHGSIEIAASLGVLSIGLRNLEGKALGAPSELRPPEVESLLEALRIATWSES